VPSRRQSLGQTCDMSTASPKEQKIDWKSHSCGDVHSLMRNQAPPISGLSAGQTIKGGPLQYIETLDLSVTELFGWGLQFLARFPHLKSLNLFSTKVSDDALVHLTESRTLLELNLCGTNISDAGLQHLKALDKLETLKVSGNKGVTDVGVEEVFQSLDALKKLEMRQTSVTPDCACKIHEALAARMRRNMSSGC